MRPNLPILALTSAAAMFTGAWLAVAGDSDLAKKDGGGGKVISAPGPDAASGPVKADAAKEKSGRPVDRLLDHIKRNNPEEYERLVSLRRENPEAFQQVLRRKFEETAAHFREKGDAARRGEPRNKGLAGEPARPQTAEGMEGKRAKAGARELEGRSREGAGARPERSANVEAAMAERMARVNGMVEEYRRARGEEREKLRSHIRENIGEVYDSRERDRTRRIRQMEEELVRMKKEIENRRELRDKIIDRKVGELLGEDPTAW
ncbi:MAG: hypothetical protein KJ579_02615 [Verrucomicrobia bacterium]|nr:hypothetical protein [Verrucomicrobiota bacterium]